jgi:hypothetical protein
MFYGANATALALANSVILIEVLKQMPRTKALALIDHAAEVLETDADRSSATAQEAAKILRREWIKVI